MEAEEVWPVADTAAAAWVVEALRLYEGRSEVRTIVPEGYDAYVEIPYRDEEDAVWAVRDVLASVTPPDQPCWFALWEGWPVPPAWRDAPTFRTPEGDLLLFSGRFQDLDVVAVEFSCAQYALSGMAPDLGPNGTAAALRAQRSHVPPSLWWPEDRTWLLAGEVDAECLYLGSGRATADLVTRSITGASLVRPIGRVQDGA